jgi:hypothetical protein
MARRSTARGARRWAALLAFALSELEASRAGAKAQPTVVFLNFSDGRTTLALGEEDDATRDVSSLCEASRVGRYWGSSDCGAREQCAPLVLETVARYFSDFDVVFTLRRPAAGPYTMVVIGPPSATCGFGVAGAARLDCRNQNPNNVVFAFDCDRSVPACSATIAQELAHSFGLAHTQLPCDLLSPGAERCAEPAFSDSNALADVSTCGTIQNNYRDLLRTLGPRTADSHRLEIEEAPPPSCLLPRGAPAPGTLSLVPGLVFLAAAARRRARSKYGCGRVGRRVESPPK